MGKGRNNKSGKKSVDTDLENEVADVPDVPVKNAADKGSEPSSSKTAAVLGPFEDLLDLQNNAEHADGSGVGGADGVNENTDKDHKAVGEETDADADAQGVEEDSSDLAPDDDDDGYLSDDSDEHLEPDLLNSIIALKRFSLTLLVPFLRKAEAKRATVTMAALLDDWKEELSPDVLQTTTYQELTTTYFSGTRYGRLQVTFKHVRDTNFVCSQIISHECVNGDIIDLTWQHPEDARFLRERILNPTAKEVVVKGVLAEITAELIHHLLVVSKLVKHGRSAFAGGFGFHRNVDPVTGLDTDRIRGLIVPHAADEYRWRSALSDDHGPGLWRLQAPQSGGEGFKNIISAVVDAQASQQDRGLERLVTNLRASMRAHVAEERKRVRATMEHMERKVDGLRWRVMADSSSQALCEELAQIYAPPHDIWTKVKRLCHNFLSGGKALLDRHFTLWSHELSCRGRKEGGLGVIDLKHRIDSTVIQNLGKALAEQEPLRNWIWERAACFPLGLATIYTHPSVLKHWLGGGARWKAAVKAPWDSKIVVIGDPAHRWDADEEQLIFSHKIFFPGKSPFGNQAGSHCLKGVRLGDLVTKDRDGSRTLKSESALEHELGGTEQRKWALQAWDATPQRWKDLLLRQLTAEEILWETAAGAPLHALRLSGPIVVRCIKTIRSSRRRDAQCGQLLALRASCQPGRRRRNAQCGHPAGRIATIRHRDAPSRQPAAQRVAPLWPPPRPGCPCTLVF
ncbi:unnamed protein product [Closterium sp. NIES-54]